MNRQAHLQVVNSSHSAYRVKSSIEKLFRDRDELIAWMSHNAMVGRVSLSKIRCVYGDPTMAKSATSSSVDVGGNRGVEERGTVVEKCVKRDIFAGTVCDTVFGYCMQRYWVCSPRSKNLSKYQ